MIAFTYCQLTFEPDFLLIHVLCMNFALLFLYYRVCVSHLKNPLDYLHLMRLNIIMLMLMIKKLLMMKLLLFDGGSCFLLNDSAASPNDKSFVDVDPNHIWMSISKCLNIIFPLPVQVPVVTAFEKYCLISLIFSEILTWFFLSFSFSFLRYICQSFFSVWVILLLSLYGKQDGPERSLCFDSYLLISF